MNSGTNRRGFTLIEAMVSAVLISVGIVAVLGAYSNITRNQYSTVQSEYMQRLALDKYDELVATEALQTQALNGDFSDRGDDQYLWQATVTATSVTNLSALTITVTPRVDSMGNLKSSINGIVYQPPQTSTTGATGP